MGDNRSFLDLFRGSDASDGALSGRLQRLEQSVSHLSYPLLSSNVSEFAATDGLIDGRLIVDEMDVAETLRQLLRKQQEQDVLVHCGHCGQWAAIKTACVHCGAPVG